MVVLPNSINSVILSIKMPDEDIVKDEQDVY